MATLGPHGFNADDHPPLTRYEPVPAGRYLAAVVESDIRSTRAGDGQFVELRFEILEGEHRGRSVYARLNLWNPSEAAVARSQAELSSICRAVGAHQVSETQELHDLPVYIEIEQRRRSDTGGVANVIRDYKAREVLRVDGTAASTGNVDSMHRNDGMHYADADFADGTHHADSNGSSPWPAS